MGNSKRNTRKFYDSNFIPTKTYRTFSRTTFSVTRALLQHAKTINNTENSLQVFEEYLERQSGNKFINLAAEIGSDCKYVAYMFYENQNRKLMAESLCDECKLEILRESCLGQPRKMVNLLLALMRCLSTPQRIEEHSFLCSIDVVGVFSSLTLKPQKGPKVVQSSASLNSFNEDMNTQEVFACAHNEAVKLSG